MLSKPILALLTISIYVFSFISVFLTKPYWIISIAILYLFIGLFLLSNYLYTNKSLVGIALITNSVFVGLGQYLELYFPLASIITNLFGGILSIVSVIVFYYWKEGKRHVQVRIKNERQEEKPTKDGSLSKFKVFIRLLKRQRALVREKGYSHGLALQFAYVEYQEEQRKSEEKNALNFVLGREVILQRHEYDNRSEK